MNKKENDFMIKGLGFKHGLVLVNKVGELLDNTYLECLSQFCFVFDVDLGLGVARACILLFVKLFLETLRAYNIFLQGGLRNISGSFV